MAGRPTLLDLYKRGEPFTVKGVVDGTEVEIPVYLHKLPPTEHQKATRAASAARARHLAVLSSPDSDEYLAIRDEVYTMGDRDALIGYLLMDDADKIRSSVEAELAADEEWSKDGYLDGLRDAWVTELADRYKEDPDDPEAKRVLEELTRFSDTVAEIVIPQIADMRASYEHTPLSTLHERVTEALVKSRAIAVWLTEFYRQQIFFGTRRPDDHSKRYFNNFDEVDQLEVPVRVQLQQGFESLTVNVAEGKDSEEIPPSSDSSGQPAAAETGVSSGPATATP